MSGYAKSIDRPLRDRYVGIRKDFYNEYNIYLGIKARCTTESHKAYPHYGGRGIKMCDRWLESFENFLEDMKPRPEGKKSIDRINNDGDYEPGNCRWATSKEQNLNYSQNRYLTYNGKTQTLHDWCLELGIKRGTIDSRLSQGYPIERVLSTINHRRKDGNLS